MNADRSPLPLTTTAAAELLQLAEPVVRALITAGYLVPQSVGEDGPRLALSDLKAFIARNADNGAGVGLLERVLDPTRRRSDLAAAFYAEDLLEVISGRAQEMARRVFDIFAGVFPEAADWDQDLKDQFRAQAQGRFEAILAVTAQGSEVDEALFEDLRAVGASAARAGSPLPQLQVVLRISRDLVVQTAIEATEGRGWSRGPALSLLLTRVLPSIDRLTDALAQGYWETMLAGA